MHTLAGSKGLSDIILIGFHWRGLTRDWRACHLGMASLAHELALIMISVVGLTSVAFSPSLRYSQIIS